MINIEVIYNSRDQVIGFEVKGHALDPERVEKYDLVCCGVSVLTLSTANGITDYLMVNPKELKAENGWLRLMLDVDEDGNPMTNGQVTIHQLDALLGSMVMGLQSIADDYPKYVQLKKRRWTSC